MLQKEYFGLGSIKKLKNILSSQKIAKIFLVRGKKSYQISGAKKIIELLLKKYQVFEFYNFETNPKIKDVIRGINEFNKFNPDLVIAIGGGSVIDMAKSINLLASQTGDPKKYIIGEKKIKKSGKKIVALPTTFGSGSEATRFATIYINKVKYSLTNKYLLPNYVLIDPELTFNLPKKIAAQSSIDAFSQAIESYWSINSTDQSKKYSEKAIKLILNHLVLAVNKSDKKSRTAISQASYLAGKAINITQTTICHALSYPMTSYFNIPHGQAVALTLSSFLVYNSQAKESQIKKTINNLVKIMGASDVYQAKEKIDNLIKEIGLEIKLSDLGIDKKGREIILKNINLERLKNNPRKLSKKEVEKILIDLK